MRAQTPPVVYCCGAGLVETLAVSQEKPGVGPEIKPIPCPDTQHFDKTDKGPKATPFAGDFKPLPAGQIEANFGGTKVNKHFRHTFHWDKIKEKCCQCVSGTLTLHVKAIGDISANDTWSIVSNGKSLQGGKISTLPKSGIIQLNAAALDALCCTHRLSFEVQDDTAVYSATLHVTACCVKKCKDQPK